MKYPETLVAREVQPLHFAFQDASSTRIPILSALFQVEKSLDGDSIVFEDEFPEVLVGSRHFVQRFVWQVAEKRQMKLSW